MTNEQLQNGAKLAEKIGAFEAQLEGWKRATMFHVRKCYFVLQRRWTGF